MLQQVPNCRAVLTEVPAGGETPRRRSVMVQGWDGWDMALRWRLLAAPLGIPGQEQDIVKGFEPWWLCGGSYV